MDFYNTMHLFLNLTIQELLDSGYGEAEIEEIFVFAFSIALENAHFILNPQQLPELPHPPPLMDPPPQPPSPSHPLLEEFNWEEFQDWAPTSPVEYADTETLSVASSSSLPVPSTPPNIIYTPPANSPSSSPPSPASSLDSTPSLQSPTYSPLSYQDDLSPTSSLASTPSLQSPAYSPLPDQDDADTGF